MAISKLPTSASLRQIMDKFEEISLQDFSSIDVITASELPVSGKEGQVCIVTDTEPNNIYFDYTKPSMSNTDIFIQYYNDELYETFQVSSKNKKINLKIRNVIQVKNNVQVNVKGYIYKDANWIALEPEKIEIYKYGDIDFVNAGEIGIYNANKTTLTKYNSNMLIKSTAKSSYDVFSIGTVRHSNLINLSSFKKAFFEISCSFEFHPLNTQGGTRLVVLNSMGNVIAEHNLQYIQKNNAYPYELWEFDRAIVELDISNINELCYLGIEVTSKTTLSSNQINYCTVHRIAVGGDVLD